MRLLAVYCLLVLVGCAPRYVTLPPTPIRLLSMTDTTAMVWESSINTSPAKHEAANVQLHPEDFGLDLPPETLSGSLNGLFLFRDVPSYRAVRRFSVILTGYPSRPEYTDDTPHLTANLHLVTVGVVACNWLPFGTRVRFPNLFGSMVFTVDDRMEERYNNTPNVDIWFPSKQAAIRFGLHRSMMEVLGPPQ